MKGTEGRPGMKGVTSRRAEGGGGDVEQKPGRVLRPHSCFTLPHAAADDGAAARGLGGAAAGGHQGERCSGEQKAATLVFSK